MTTFRLLRQTNRSSRFAQVTVEVAGSNQSEVEVTAMAADEHRREAELGARWALRGLAVAKVTVTHVVVTEVDTSAGDVYEATARADDRELRVNAIEDLRSVWRCLDQWGGNSAAAALLGASYGGYMVLAGMAFQPTLWRAGVDIMGISSLTTYLQNTSPYLRGARECEYGFLDSDRDLLERLSPVNHAHHIDRPMLIIHGANDPKVPVGESQAIHEILTQHGIPTRLIIYPDEGHGFGQRANRDDAYGRIMAFLKDQLT